jgi:hypothetical protein
MSGLVRCELSVVRKARSFPIWCRPWREALGVTIAGLLLGSEELRAQSIQDAISSSGGITYSISGTTVSTDVANGATPLPTTFTLGTFSGQSEPYTLSNSIAGSFDYTMPTDDAVSGALFDYASSSGPVTLSSSADINLQGMRAGAADELGNAAIRVLGQPLGYSGTTLVGADVTLTDTGNITVAGNGFRASSGPALDPAGFRSAALSGILAMSYGKQDSAATTSHPGGSVDVTLSSATISMSQADPTVITAGISASSASGTGSDAFGVGDIKPVSVELNAGTITNSSGSGAGVIATATGARLANSGDSEAFGSTVGVMLDSGSNVTLTGQTGVGVLAMSASYMAGEAKKSQNSQSGDVFVTINDSASSITTGGSGSVFAAGVLAVSTGTSMLVDPFSTNVVSGSGFGDSGQVSIINAGSVSTNGTLSTGLAGLSIGGAAIATTSVQTSGVSYLGTTGAYTEGNGGAVSITNTGSIKTIGSSAYGIVALSSSGGGLINNEFDPAGDAQNPQGLVVGNNSSTSSDSGNTTVNGGAITVENSGSVTTGDGLGSGAASIGIVAQSIGGGGGNAGGDKAALFVGDAGGKGGAGGAIQLTQDSTGQLLTKDVNSLGILAQSIGGGGGNGANAKGVFVAVGGRGGAGGSGGQINLGINGSVTTLGEHSAGIIAQSIGGGGGNGGTAKSVGLLIDVGIGGAGGNAGAGGTVGVDLASGGSVSTLGNNSAGMILQSVGGGGGSGGGAFSGSVSSALDINYSMGGSGTGGGLGGSVTGTNEGAIVTGVPNPGVTVSLPNMEGADSAGMMAQSIGGGGGHGGGAAGKDLVVQNPVIDATVSANVSVGGAGGSGSDGGQAGLTNSGSVTTWGDGSYGLLSQSIGGGGGNGGDSTLTSLVLALSGPQGELKLAVGGTGGSGGKGGVASALNNGASAIHTWGQDAPAILAQSIGGGGGTAGIGNSGRKPAGGSNAEVLGAIPTQLTIAVGGAGGSGGDSAYTTVTNNGTISTFGSGSQGIVAQSIGGGGGLAGGGNSSGDNYALTINLGFGGAGGSGGNATTSQNGGNSVSVTNGGSVTTHGGDGTAILAQSIGGGGGTGGSSDATASVGIVGTVLNAVTFAKGYSPKLNIGLGIGGTGGSGGAGGNVNIQQTGVLSTAGSRAYGIVAQSISGGGGNGGTATAAANPGLVDGYDGTIQFNTTLAVGGSGGDGNNGGNVTLVNSGTIATSGYGSHGVVAQSVAGGGGIGADGTTDIQSTLGLGIGASGSTGGSTASSGGAVAITLSGSVTTTSGDASGVVAQSIGGGGGLATTGSNPTQTIPEFTAGALPIRVDGNFGINGSSSSSSNGGGVTITPSSTITTSGDWSHGIVAQSLGAGGGKASTIFGTNSNAYANLAVTVGGSHGAGNGDTVSLGITGTAGTISTGTASTGYGAIGLIAQSIGGGGGLYTDGSSAATGTLDVGGVGGSSSKGTGGTVELKNSTNGTSGSPSMAATTIQTQGDLAYGVVLQSIGAGGGIGATGSSQTYQGTPVGSAPQLTVGGAGTDGNGGGVQVDSTATSNLSLTIETHGANAFGLVAQSIGGGGGIATSKQIGTAVLGASAPTLSSDHYNGGTVSLTLPGSITTSGAGAHGVVAQSIGGGGGIANPDASSGLTNSKTGITTTSALGYGGNVTVTLSGNVTTSGAGASGIVAQSIGGGGGLIGNYAGSTGGASASGNSSDGNTGTVIVDQTQGSINATGAGATGIFAQNVTAGDHGLGSVEVTVGGTVHGGAGSGAYGVWVDGGNTGDTLTVNDGALISADSGIAVNYTGSVGKLSVTNGGNIIGDIMLNSSSTLTNNGILTKPTAITVHDLANNGTLSLDNRMTSLALTGDLTQSSSGSTSLDVWGADAGLFNTINISGSVGMDGGLTVNFINGFVPQIGQTFEFISAASGTYTFHSIVVTGLPGGADWQSIESGGDFSLQFTAVPESSSYAAGIAIVLGGIAFVRHRARAAALAA